jgi:hypothetical protein
MKRQQRRTRMIRKIVTPIERWIASQFRVAIAAPSIGQKATVSWRARIAAVNQC